MPAQVGFVVHATTVATNAIIEGKIARSGFVTTEGFRDMLEIARQVRPSLYDTQFEKPRPLVPRDRASTSPSGSGRPARSCSRSTRLGARRRRDPAARGASSPSRSACCTPTSTRSTSSASARSSPRSCPASRSRSRRGRARVPRVPARLDDRDQRRHPARRRAVPGADRGPLADAGIEAKLLVMQSSGGVFSSEAARERPVFMVESGPAAGVIAAAYLGETLGHPDILSFDMGGTTAKVGLIQGGQPSVTKDYEVGGHAGASIGGMSLSGYPVRTPVVDLVEIGAGGGSIAWVDSGGLLRVGPQSAGADPGPACYGRGGTEPTVTDANVVLGRLNPDYFLGGEIGLDVEGARAGDRGAVREAARAQRHRGRERDRRDRERGDGQRAPPDLGPAGLRPARLRARRLRRCRAGARERAHARRRDADAAHPPQPRHLLRDGPADDRHQARRGRDGDAPARRPRPGRDGGDLPRARGGGPRRARARGAQRRGDRVRPQGRPPLRRAELRAHDPARATA